MPHLAPARIAPWLLLAVVATTQSDPAALARDYAQAVEAVNRAQADKPTAKDEAELGKRLPAKAAAAVAALVELPASPQRRPADAPAGNHLAEALATAARAALDLDRGDDFRALRARLLEVDAALANQVGILCSRPRFVAIGTGGITEAGLAQVADVFDLVLDGYADVFGLTNFSKVPGKKLRLRVHLEAKIEKPPHFAPQFPWHSEIDFPVVDADAFRSPTKDGKFLFYGLCHELGHVIAMWGDRQHEEDRHAWAHYTGVVIVEHLLAGKKDAPALRDVRDGRWRSLEFERKQLAAKKVVPGPADADTVFMRLLALHDTLGPRAIGEALAALDTAGRHLLVNRVRYYAMRDFRAALLATKAGRTRKRDVDAAFAGS